ncbi:integrase, catalytic region, zinc finger, CCHC-type containing protein [Tanacetum coccineum]
MALGYQNPFYLKQAQQKQQSLYNGKVLLEKHDPPTVYDSEETLELAQERVDITTKTRGPQPRSNTKNDRALHASKSSRIKNKEVKVEDHPRNLLLSKNKKHMSSECNNIKLAIRNDKSKIVCAMCYPNMIMFLGTVRFGNDHVAAILGFGDLQWGNILITRVYFVEGLGHNLFSVGQFCDSDLERFTSSYGMDLCGPMRIASINGKRYILVIVDDYSRYTWVVFLRSKDEAPKEIKTFLKRITILLQAPVITCATLKIAPSFTVDLTKHHTSLLTAENRISPFFMYLGLSVIQRMIVKISGSLVQKVILAFSLVILLIPVLTESTTEEQRKSWRP